MGIRAVAFDFGNVISIPQDPRTIGALAAIGGVDEEKARDIVFNGRDDWDRGDLSGFDFYRRGFARHGKEVGEDVLEEFQRADLESWANLNEGTVRLMEEVLAAGYRTAILSNAPHEFIALARRRFPIVGKVHVGLFSAEHSVIKPVRAIYELLLGKLDMEAPEVLFFDDVRANIEAAREVGIEAHLWLGPEDARRKLAETGVLKP